MAKSSDRAGRADKLKNRQLNNVNSLISGPQPKAQPEKRLLDRMTFADQPQPVLPAEETNPRKRKRHEADKLDYAQQKKKHRSDPMSNTSLSLVEPCDEKKENPQSPIDGNEVISSGGAKARDRTHADNEPRDSQDSAIISDRDRENDVDSHRVVTANYDSVSRAETTSKTATAEAKATKTAPGYQSIQLSAEAQLNDSVTSAYDAHAEAAQGSATEKISIPIDGSNDIAINSSTSIPSPPPSKESSPTAKRPLTDVEAELVEHASKKQCLTDARLPTPELTDYQHRRVNDKLKRSCKTSRYVAAPVVANPECPHTYAEYDDDSIPILQSASIHRRESPTLLNNPSVELRVQAHILLENGRGFTAEDMGRPNVPKSGRTRAIDSVDLYLKTDGKIYVATERGLLLAAHYLKLAGIGDTTPVRFKGIKPAWFKASVAQRFSRKAETTTDDPDAPERENPFLPLPKGDLGLMIGYVVQVYERHPTNGRAFGRRVDNDKLGWFDWENTTDLYAPYSEWEGLFTPDILMMVPADPSLIATTPKRAALPAAPARTPTQSTKVRVSAPSKTETQKQPAEVSKTSKASTLVQGVTTTTDKDCKTGAIHARQEVKTARSSPKLRAPVSSLPANEANKDNEDKKTRPGDNIKDGNDSETSLEAATVDKPIEPKKEESPQTEKYTSPGQSALYDRSVEDEVDWDDDEL
jgi:hypothetical protein